MGIDSSAALGGAHRPGFTSLPNWLYGKATAQELALLGALQLHFPCIRPSMQRLAEKAGMQRTCAYRVMADLERKGWVVRIARTTEEGRRLPNGYELRIWPTDEAMARAVGAHQDPLPTLPTLPTDDPIPTVRETDSRTVRETDTRFHCVSTVRETDTGVRETDRGPSARRTGEGPRDGQEEDKYQEEQDQELRTPCSPPAAIERTALVIATTPPLPPVPGGVALASQESDQDQQPVQALPSASDANRQPSTTTKLPACAEPHRELVTAWWRQRCASHPTAARTLDAASITAIEHADACGVLLPFLRQAVSEVPKSLGHQYRKRVAALMAPSTDGFDAFKAAYLAARKRATNQSISRAITEYGRTLATGITPDQLLAALRANIRAQHEAEAHGGFAACLPDMARWLKGGLWEAYAPQQGASGASAVPFPPLPARAISEGPLDDPFAHARKLEARRLTAAGQRTTTTTP